MDYDNVIDMEAARMRLNAISPTNPIQDALDVLALALTEHNHIWTDHERQLYENATCYVSGDCKEIDL